MAHATQIMTVRAPVDNQIVPLVAALLEYEEVATLYSCQGHHEGKADFDFARDSSYVIFTVGNGSFLELTTLLEFLTDRLHGLAFRVSLELAVVAFRPQLELRVFQGDIPRAAGWVSNCRKSWVSVQHHLQAAAAKLTQ